MQESKGKQYMDAASTCLETCDQWNNGEQQAN